MPTASSILLALGLIIVIGGAATAWLWTVQRLRVERDHGLWLLSAMRWREFSKLVVDALGPLGFELEVAEDTDERNQDSVLRLRRDGLPWLLTCKQGGYRVTPAVVSDMIDAVRFHGAKGGLIATTGTVEGEAGRQAGGRVELMDGAALWPLVKEQLTPGVRGEIEQKSRQATLRQCAIAWSCAAVFGVLFAFALPKGEDTSALSAAPAPANATRPASGSAAPEIATAPISEDEQRDEVIRAVSTLAGVERALWSTRSTLMIYLATPTADPFKGVCGVVERYESLRTSRIHLQPPAGSGRPARFRQCRTF